MTQTGFTSNSFPYVSVMSLPLKGRSAAYSRTKNTPSSPMKSQKRGLV